MYQDSLFQVGGWVAPQSYPKLHGTVALDFETHDPLLETHGPGWCFPNGGHILGAAVSGVEENGKPWSGYWSFAHASGNLPKEHVMGWLGDELDNPNLTVLAHNAPYELGWLRHEGIRPRAKFLDTGVAAPLIDENRLSYQLDSLGKDWLGVGKDLSLFQECKRALGLNPRCAVKEVKKRLRLLPAHLVGPYAEQDAVLTRRLWLEKCVPQMDKEELWDIFNLETRLQAVLVDMRARGVKVNVARAEQASAEMALQLKELKAQMRRIAGQDIEVWSAESVAKALDKLSIKYPKTPAGAPSFRAGWLEEHEHPLPKLIVKTRQVDKAKNTFIDGAILGHAVKGRIHGVFSPLRSDEGGAVTGRFSSSNPNLQNLPSRDEIMAALIRGLFEPEDGQQWAAVDYSSQEPRLAVHFANIARVKGVEPFVKGYLENPDLDFHSYGAEITGLARKSAKNITLGIMYGMGGAKLCVQLGLPTKWIDVGRNGAKKMIEVAGDEGQAIIDRYNKYMPFVKALSELATRKAEQRGWIRTLLGRMRHFESKDHPKGAYPYKALNCLIQGSAADMLKKAMCDLHDAGIVPLVTVHDELGLSVDGPAQAKKHKLIMIDAVKLSLPVTADIEIGATWGLAA